MAPHSAYHSKNSNNLDHIDIQTKR